MNEVTHVLAALEQGETQAAERLSARERSRSWCWRTPVRPATLRGAAGNVEHIAFSPDDRQILTVGGGEVKLWDLSSGHELLMLRSEGMPVQHASFGADGRHIWAGLDGAGRFWGWDATPIGNKKLP